MPKRLKKNKKQTTDLSKYAGQWVALQTFADSYKVVGSGKRLKDISHLVSTTINDPRLNTPGKVPAAFKVPAKEEGELFVL